MSNVDYNDGKIHGWNGGDCPVHPESDVQYWVRSGKKGNYSAKTLDWDHTPDSHNAFDVIAFCVVKQYKEPLFVWLNEYVDRVEAYATKNIANIHATCGVVRIAVKYKEVTEE
jgi:hypothetical protein